MASRRRRFSRWLLLVPLIPLLAWALLAAGDATGRDGFPPPVSVGEPPAEVASEPGVADGSGPESDAGVPRFPSATPAARSVGCGQRYIPWILVPGAYAIGRLRGRRSAPRSRVVRHG